MGRVDSGALSDAQGEIGGNGGVVADHGQLRPGWLGKVGGSGYLFGELWFGEGSFR